MPSGYDSIPAHATTPASDVNEKPAKPHSLYLIIGVILVCAAIFAPSKTSFDEVPATAKAVEPATPWPQVLMKIGGGFGDATTFPSMMPTDTKAAATAGWEKIDAPCNPLMGEEWKYGGEASSTTSASIYFTPEVGDSPGIVSGIEVDFYGYVVDNLVGSYFGEEKTSADGSYRSVSLSFFDGSKYDLCDSDSAFVQPEFEYLTIAPDMAATKVPVKNDSKILTDVFKEGACMVGMGFHWATDVVGGKDLTWKAENLVPVVPMYSSTDGMLNAVFFQATGRKQVWPAECAVVRDMSQPCARPHLNLWDVTPGLTEASNPGFFACSNFCGDCNFTGSPDGMYTTMHWFFRPVIQTELCSPMPDPSKVFFCRQGDYPPMLP